MAYISNKVRYYHSGMTDAPVLSGTAGALIAVLDACLVNGFGTKAINNLTVTDGIATAQISSGHTFGEGDVLRVAGVTGALSGLNDDWRLASVTADTVTWSVEGLSIPAGSATGTITCLRAPAGWEKVFADGTTRAAYRSLKHAEHNGLILYVADTGTTTARVLGYASMTDIDTGAGPFPTDAQISGGLWWAKANNTTGSRAWAIAADSSRINVCPAYSPSAQGSAPCYTFGRLLDAMPGDTLATMVSGATTSSNALNSLIANGTVAGLYAYATNSTVAGVYLAGSASGVSGSVQAEMNCAGLLSSLSGSSLYWVSAALTDPLSGSFAHIYTAAMPRGLGCGPRFLRRFVAEADAAGFDMVGAPGAGAVLIRCNLKAGAYLLDLGANGRWD